MSYERFAPYYDAVYGGIVDYAGDVRWLREAFRRYSGLPVSRVLDLGCGTGNHATRLAEEGFDVTGIDLSPALVGIARAKGSPARFLVGDMSRDLPEGAVDAAISMFGAFCHLLADVDVARMLTLLRDRLPPGGLLAFEFWSPYGWRPAPRQEIYELGDGRRLVRKTTPQLEINDDDVYRFKLEHLVFQGDAVEARFTEEHGLRLRTPAATRILLEASGFRVAALTCGARGGKTWDPPAHDELRVMCIATRR